MPFAQFRKQVLKRETEHLEIRLLGIRRQFRKLCCDQEATGLKQSVGK
jgi:hypothetical protein